MVERVHGRRGVPQQQRPLPEIVEQQRRQSDAEPGELNRPVAEVAEVGVQRLAAGHDEEDGPQHDEPPIHVRREDAHGVLRQDRGEHAGLVDDLLQPEDRDGREPHEHHPAEDRPDARGALALEQEQADEDDQRERNHPIDQARRGDLESLDGAHHGDRRGQRAVGIDQGGAEDAEHDHDLARR